MARALTDRCAEVLAVVADQVVGVLAETGVGALDNLLGVEPIVVLDGQDWFAEAVLLHRRLRDDGSSLQLALRADVVDDLTVSAVDAVVVAPEEVDLDVVSLRHVTRPWCAR